MVGLIVTVILTLVISIIWAKSIGNMKEKHSEYRNEDFLNWDREHKDWDDNKNHTEGGF